MPPRRHYTLALIALVAGMLASGCFGKKPPPTAQPIFTTITSAPDARVKAPMTLSATADTNPDGNGRPSPVVVRVYQLRTDMAFAAAEFFPLFDDDQKALGPELISRDEFVLQPGDQRIVDVTVAADARVLGVVAAFRDIRNAQWRVVLPLTARAQVQRRGLTLAVERARVVLSVPAN